MFNKDSNKLPRKNVDDVAIIAVIVILVLVVIWSFS